MLVNHWELTTLCLRVPLCVSENKFSFSFSGQCSNSLHRHQIASAVFVILVSLTFIVWPKINIWGQWLNLCNRNCNRCAMSCPIDNYKMMPGTGSRQCRSVFSAAFGGTFVCMLFVLYVLTLLCPIGYVRAEHHCSHRHPRADEVHRVRVLQNDNY